MAKIKKLSRTAFIKWARSYGACPEGLAAFRRTKSSPITVMARWERSMSLDLKSHARWVKDRADIGGWMKSRSWGEVQMRILCQIFGEDRVR